jgi:internalin A
MSILEPLLGLEELYFRAGYGGDFPARSEICDVSQLKHLPKLHTLSLDFAGDTVDGFAELTQIKTLILNLERYETPDVSPLGELVQLEKLGLSCHNYYSRHGITGLSALEALVNLIFLRVNDVKAKSLAPMKNMTKLQKLDCANNHIRTVKPLENLTDLRELYINNNSIRNIAALSGLTRLTELILGGNPITDFSPIRGLPHYKPEWEPKVEDD